MKRLERYRAFTFEQWVKIQKHVDQSKVLDMNSLSYTNAIANVLLGSAGFPTRRTQGKQKANAEKLVYTQQLMKQYLLDVPELTREVELDPNSETDQAYVRVREKRAKKSPRGHGPK